MARERVQTRCDPATVEQIDDFADEHDLSKSEAVRRVVRSGLRSHDYEVAVVGGNDDTNDEIPDDYAEAHISETARTVGGVLIGVALLLVLFAELGVI